LAGLNGSPPFFLHNLFQNKFGSVEVISVYLKKQTRNDMYTEVINAKFKVGDTVLDYAGKEWEVIEVYSIQLGVNKYIIENELLGEWHEQETNLKLK